MTSEEIAELDAKIAKTKELISATEDAILAVVSGSQNYQLDTGQSRILVTKANLASIKNMLQYLESRLVQLQRARSGCGTYIARPGF
jgi:cysteine sulfinate desulfinase/cysteine desulfurase-like protein